MRKNILVVGGSGFIGGAIAAALMDESHVVAISTSGSGKKGFVKLDVMDRGSVEIARLRLNEAAIKLDAIVYAVGDCPKGGFMDEINKPLTTIDPMELQKNLDLHVTGFLNVVQGLVSCMVDGGHIVVISSAVTRLNDAPADKVPPFLTIGHYAAAKSAQDALIGWLRKDAFILRKGIKIHRLAPPAVDSPFHIGTPAQFSPQALLPVSVIADATVQALAMTEGYLNTDFMALPPQK